MDKRIIVILIILGFILTVFMYSYAEQEKKPPIQNNTIQNTPQNNAIQEDKGQKHTAKENDVTVIQKGPTTPQKRGTEVPIYCTITNKGKNTIYETEIIANNGDDTKYLGTIKPGETRKYTYMLYIPTDEDFISWMGNSYELENPWDVGVYHIVFKDKKGVLHKKNSNSILIKWFD